MKPNATIARSMASRILRSAATRTIDERRRVALELAPMPTTCQVVKRLNRAAPNPRNQNSLGICSEPVNPEVGAAFVPGGPVIIARISAAAIQTPSRRAAALAARRANWVENGTRAGLSTGSGPGRTSVSRPVGVMLPSPSAHPRCRSGGTEGA